MCSQVLREPKHRNQLLQLLWKLTHLQGIPLPAFQPKSLCFQLQSVVEVWLWSRAMQTQEFNEFPCAQVRTVSLACRGRCFTLMTANLKAISFTITPLQKINCCHCAAAASSSFQFARALRSLQELNGAHEMITGTGACLWSLGCFTWISATLVCSGICCFTQPLLSGALRKAVHYLGGTEFQSCGIQETPSLSAVHFRNDFSISTHSVNAAETAPAHRCVQPTLSTGAVVYWLPEVPEGQKANTADIAGCSSQQLRMSGEQISTPNRRLENMSHSQRCQQRVETTHDHSDAGFSASLMSQQCRKARKTASLPAFPEITAWCHWPCGSHTSIRVWHLHL